MESLRHDHCLLTVIRRATPRGTPEEVRLVDDNAVLDHLANLGLGLLERPSIVLKGRLIVDGLSTADPVLCQTDQGLWLLAGVTDDDVRAIPLHDRTDLRYEDRLRGDRIHVAGEALEVGVRAGGAAKVAVGIGRLRGTSNGNQRTPLPKGRYFEDVSAVEQAWIDSVVPSDEILLAWLETSSEVVISPSPLGEVSAYRRYLLSDQRNLLVAVSEVGDARAVTLESVPLHMTDGKLRDTVTVTDWSWTTSVGNRQKYRDVARVQSLGAADRLREMARMNWLHGDQTDRLGESMRLLTVLHDRRLATVLDHLTMCVLPIVEPLDDADHGDQYERLLDEATQILTETRQTDELATDLASWYLNWEIPVPIGMDLIRRLVIATGPDRAEVWIDLHRSVRQAADGKEFSDGFRVLVDLNLAEHLIAAGSVDEATELLESCLLRLPSEQIEDILPADDQDLVAGEGGQLLRIRALDLLAVARQEAGQPDPVVLVELARLQPLVPERIEPLCRVDDSDLADRARQTLALYEPGALATAPERTEQRLLRPLDPDAVQVLQHPAARKGGAFSWLVKALAQPDVPDRRQLSAYVERVDVARYPELTADISDAALVLGYGTPPAYVSRGDRAVGIRGFDAKPPYLLIGADHLEESSIYFMDPSAFQFAVASEVAHLRLGHKRVTSAEVWSGIWGKTATGVGIAASAMSLALAVPGLSDVIRRSIDAREAYGALRTFVPLGVLKAVTGESDGRKVITALSANPGGNLNQGLSLITQHSGRAQDMARKILPAKGESLDADSVAASYRQQIGACRVMQLTADRAGLLLCGDIRGAIRAMFLAEKDNRPELDTAVRHGLLPTLSRRDANGNLILQGLAVRIAALVSFYLSDDFVVLRDKILA